MRELLGGNQGRAVLSSLDPRDMGHKTPAASPETEIETRDLNFDSVAEALMTLKEVVLQVESNACNIGAVVHASDRKMMSTPYPPGVLPFLHSLYRRLLNARALRMRRFGT